MVCHRRLSYVFRDPLNEVAAVLVLDIQHLLIHLLHGHVAPEYCRRGQVVAVMFLASNMCWVSLATVSATYCWLLQLLSGVKPGMQNCSQGNRTLLIASLCGSALSCPGKGRQLVTPLMVADQVVDVPMGGCGQFQSSKADVIGGLVINPIAFSLGYL